MRGCGFLLVLTVLAGLGTFAEEVRTLRVGFRAETSFEENSEHGGRTGFVVDLIKGLAARGKWNVKWVDVPWGEALCMADRKEFDIFPCSINSPEIRKSLLIGHVPIGFWRMSVFALAESALDGRNIRGLDGLVIGVPRGHVMVGGLHQYFSEAGISCVIREYPDRRSLERALFAGDVGAVFSAPNETLNCEKVLFTLPSEPMYLAVTKDNAQLLDELDRELGGIIDNEPEFLQALQNRYSRFELPPVVAYSARENAWILRQKRQHKVFKVDLSPLDGYYKRRDKTTGAFSGFSVLVVQELERLTGLDFELTASEDHATLDARFARGDMDVIMPFGCNYHSQSSEIDSVRGFLVANAQAVCTRRPHPVDIHNRQTTIAISEKDTRRLAAYCKQGGTSRLVICSSIEAAFQAMVDGRADCIIGDYPVIRRLVEASSRASDLDFRIGLDFRYHSNFPIRVSPQADPEFVAVLAKALGSISDARFIEIADLAESQGLGSRGISARRLLRLVVPIAVLGLIVAVFALLLIRRKMMNLLHRSSMSLEVAQKSINEAAKVRRELEVALEKAEFQARSKTNFLATMSHEIRTPLNAVIGYSEFLSEPGVAPEKVKEYARGITLSANSLLALINDVLDISKFESGKREGLDLRKGRCDLQKLFEEMSMVFRMRCREKNLEIRFTIADDFPPLVLDDSRIRQILFNLVGNSIKFTDKGGIDVEARYEADELMLRVRDTGIGITAKGMKHIFDPFAQDMESRQGRIYAGTGLGLSIVKRLVESSNGSISVESEVGKGSTFTIRLPKLERFIGARKRESVHAEGRPSAGIANRPVTSVLIVDDMMMNRQIMQLHCQSLGLRDVRTFASGADAIEHLGKGDLPDLILTDMWMPGMDGSALAKAVKEKWPQIPVVAVTADTDPGSKFDVTAFSAILAKPVTGTKLKNTFARLGFREN